MPRFCPALGPPVETSPKTAKLGKIDSIPMKQFACQTELPKRLSSLNSIVSAHADRFGTPPVPAREHSR